MYPPTVLVVLYSLLNHWRVVCIFWGLCGSTMSRLVHSASPLRLHVLRKIDFCRVWLHKGRYAHHHDFPEKMGSLHVLQSC